MKIPFWKSIKVRSIAGVIVMLSIPFGILQLANLFLIYHKLQLKTVYTTEALSHSIATNVTEFMQSAYDASKMLARNEEIMNGGADGATLLKEAVKQMPYFRLFYVQDMTGQQFLRSAGKLENRANRWWFKKIIVDRRPFISEAYVSVNHNELVTSIFLPMYHENKMAGVFGADFTLDTIHKAARQYWNKDIRFMILDGKGSVLTSTDFKPGEYINYLDYTKRTVVRDQNGHFILDANGQIVTRVQKIEASPIMQKIISGALKKKTSSFQFRDGNNIVVCAYQPIRLPGNSEPWSVIVFQKQTDYITLVLLVGLFIFLILCSIILSLRLINANILKPVLAIQRDMAEIVAGRLDVRIDISGDNEIGELADDINRMVASLKYHQQRIDADEKMAALGNLVAGVAHEINTPLGIGVTTSSYMQKINLESRKALNEGRFSKQDLLHYMESMNESLELLQYNLERGSTIIQSFKKIAVDQTFETLEEFNVRQYIDSVVVSLVHEYKKSNHVFQIECDPDLVIKSYPGVLAQILTNFIMNSIIHGFRDMEHGVMTIVARRENNLFTLRYSDNGRGIDPENLPKVFTPFFTTRKDAGGSGLGLNIVYNLVTQKLNGSISVASELGKGVEFFIKIPV